MNFYLRAFLIFFRIGLFTIGGGYAMVPLIEADLVDKRKWVKKEDFLDLMALAQTVPGIFAVNIAIFIGYKLKGFWGAFWMALGTILPSFLIILTIALFFRQFQHVEAVEHVFKGIRPAVVALIAAPTFKMAKSARINRYNIWIPVVSALLIWLLGFSPIYVIYHSRIAYVGRRIDTDRTGSHLADSDDVRKIGRTEPFVTGDYLSLYHGNHGVTSSYGE
jgi:chromate transporter